jgi:hypothetical protein
MRNLFFVYNSLCGYNGFSLLNQYYFVRRIFEILYDAKTTSIHTTLLSSDYIV